jgi:Family of unknown function (DUF6074)
MTLRERLPNRRAAETFEFECASLRYTCTVSRYANGRIAEIFLTNHKSNSAADTGARDAAIAFSFAVQHGTDPEAISPGVVPRLQGPRQRCPRPGARSLATARRSAMKAPLAHQRGRRHRAKLIPFPLALQRPLVVMLAARMAAQIPARAEKTLNAELQRRIDALHRQGFSDSAVERQVKAFEAAIRAELWRIVLLPPAPDGAA